MAEAREGLRARQKQLLEQALSLTSAYEQQGIGDPVAVWRQACRALLAATDPDVQNDELASAVAAAQARLYRQLADAGHRQELDAIYTADSASFWQDVPAASASAPVNTESSSGDSSSVEITQPLRKTMASDA